MKLGQAFSTFRAALARTAPGVIVTLVLLALQVADFGSVRQLGNMTFDLYQRLSPRPYQPTPVRVVDIDDETIRRLGQWPWPRTEVARLTRMLADAGAAAIAFDMVFSEPDRTSPARMAAILRENPDAHGDYADIARLTDHDILFGQTLAKTPTVAGFFLTRETNANRPVVQAGAAFAGTPPLDSLPTFNGAIVPLAVIGRNARGNGFVSLEGDRDGIIRRAPLLSRIGDQVVPSLGLEALRVAQGAGAVVIKSSDASGERGSTAPTTVAVKVGDFEAPTTRSGELWMYYTRPVPERIVPAWKLLENRLPPAELDRLFSGSIVFVGTGAAGLRDIVSTPVADRDLGVIVHAEVAEQMILGRFLTRPDWVVGLERALVVVLGLGIGLALPWIGSWIGALAGLTALSLTVSGSWFAFRDDGLLIDPTWPSLAVILSYGAVALAGFYREERQRAYLHGAFGRYLSPALVHQIARNPGSLELGGEDRDMTVLFCDIRGFSRLSERMSARGTIDFLIRFLTPMTDVLIEQRATIDKYIGDAILAFWNAPIDDPDHPRNAAHAALAMIARLRELNAMHADDPSWPGEVKIGIGLNSGLCCVGNMGSAQRLSYSLIGDTVNLASRLEGLTKYYGVEILIGGATAAHVADFALIEVDRTRVVGRDTPEAIHILAGDATMAASAAFRAIAARQQRLLAAYRARDWDTADILARETKGDPAAALLHKAAGHYRERIAAFRITPPPADWDAVHDAAEK